MNHLEILKNGPEEWNNWRKQNPFIKPSLVNCKMESLRLEGINLQGSDVRNSSFKESVLRNSDFSYSLLNNVDFRFANLYKVNFKDSNLKGCDLRFSILDETIITNTILPHYSIVPQIGNFIGWKKNEKLVTPITITDDAIRITPLNSRKCRTNKCIIFNGIQPFILSSIDFDPDIRKDNGNGIIFYITKREAEEKPFEIDKGSFKIGEI